MDESKRIEALEARIEYLEQALLSWAIVNALPHVTEGSVWWNRVQAWVKDILARFDSSGVTRKLYEGKRGREIEGRQE